jgi:hypothetical protein
MKTGRSYGTWYFATAGEKDEHPNERLSNIVAVS